MSSAMSIMGTDNVKGGGETCKPYCDNFQVVVVHADKAEEDGTVESVADLSCAAEAGSAGEAALKDLGYDVTSLSTQSDALMNVAAGTSDACVIDLLMAGAMIGEGTSYENLVYTASLNSEEYGVGFRQGSDLAELLNQFFIDTYADGTMQEIAEKYGVQESLIEQK